MRQWEFSFFSGQWMGWIAQNDEGSLNLEYIPIWAFIAISWKIKKIIQYAKKQSEKLDTLNN